MFRLVYVIFRLLQHAMRFLVAYWTYMTTVGYVACTGLCCLFSGCFPMCVFYDNLTITKNPIFDIIVKQN
jgi:hypothetical protein